MDDLTQWKEFNLAIVGAAAALAGLVIVAASVNIADIVKSRPLTSRLGTAIVMLVLALVVSSIGLMPGVDPLVFGVFVLIVALLAAIFPVATARLLANDTNARDRARFLKSLLGFLPSAAYVVAGSLSVIAHPSALYAAAGGALLAIAAAIVVSWVALVEVLR